AEDGAGPEHGRPLRAGGRWYEHLEGPGRDDVQAAVGVAVADRELARRVPPRLGVGQHRRDLVVVEAGEEAGRLAIRPARQEDRGAHCPTSPLGDRPAARPASWWPAPPRR